MAACALRTSVPPPWIYGDVGGSRIAVEWCGTCLHHVCTLLLAQTSALRRTWLIPLRRCVIGLERGTRELALGVKCLRAHLSLIRGDVANGINPILGRLDPGFDAGVLGEQVQQVRAA
jgi:hypothetical protein